MKQKKVSGKEFPLTSICKNFLSLKNSLFCKQTKQNSQYENNCSPFFPIDNTNMIIKSVANNYIFCIKADFFVIVIVN